MLTLFSVVFGILNGEAYLRQFPVYGPGSIHENQE